MKAFSVSNLVPKYENRFIEHSMFFPVWYIVQFSLLMPPTPSAFVFADQALLKLLN